jgi:hypothetical protein
MRRSRAGHTRVPRLRPPRIRGLSSGRAIVPNWPPDAGQFSSIRRQPPAAAYRPRWSFPFGRSPTMNNSLAKSPPQPPTTTPRIPEPVRTEPVEVPPQPRQHRRESPHPFGLSLSKSPPQPRQPRRESPHPFGLSLSKSLPSTPTATLSWPPPGSELTPTLGQHRPDRRVPRVRGVDGLSHLFSRVAQSCRDRSPRSRPTPTRKHGDRK